MKHQKFIVLFSLFVFFMCSSLHAEKSEEPAKLGDVFGTKGGYFHPFGSISMMSSDNIFYSKDDPSSDSISVLSIGIWAAVPASREQILDLKTSSYAPGGLEISRSYKPFLNRYQLYFLYSTNVEQYTKYTDSDIQKHKAEAFFQYNLKGGLSFEFVGEYFKSGDEKELSRVIDPDTYSTNLTGVAVIYHISEMSRLEFETSGFSVAYDEEKNISRNRSDKTIKTKFYTGLTAKSNLFVGYENISIKYDQGLTDSTQTQMFGGLSWNVTAKSSGTLSLGQSKKKFSDASSDEVESAYMELSASLAFTEKTSLSTKGSMKIRESTMTGVDYLLNSNISISYKQQVTEKFTMGATYSKSSDTYKATIGNDRVNTTTNPELIVGYRFTKWLLAEAGYSYTDIASNNSDFNASNTSMYVRVTGYL